MIRALEQHLARWVQQQMDELAQETPLYSPVDVVAGAGSAGPGQKELRVQIWLQSLKMDTESLVVGLAPATLDETLRARAGLTLRVTGPIAPRASGGGVVIEPGWATMHAADLVMFTLLARLRRRLLPLADEQQPDGGPDGRAAATGGTRSVTLEWSNMVPGEAVLSESANTRSWEIPLTGMVTFRLTPEVLEGGRIEQIPIEHAERLPTPEEG